MSIQAYNRVRELFPQWLVHDTLSTLEEAPQELVHWSTYAGTKQKNIGYRESLAKGKDKQRMRYNAWLPAHCPIMYGKYMSALGDLFGKPVVPDKEKSLPVFHFLNKPLNPAVDGAHTDLSVFGGPKKARDQYFDQDKYTALTYLKNADEGGRLILYSKERDQLYLNMMPGDMVLFKSSMLHDIEPFKTEDFRITMVCQFQDMGHYVKMFI